MNAFVCGLLSGLVAIAVYELCEWLLGRRKPIVRCKDCKFSNVVTDCYFDKPFLGCDAEWCEGSEGDHPIVEPDGFCKWGERRK